VPQGPKKPKEGRAIIRVNPIEDRGTRSAQTSTMHFSGINMAKIRQRMTILQEEKEGDGEAGLNKTAHPRNQQLKRQGSKTWVGRNETGWSSQTTGQTGQ